MCWLINNIVNTYITCLINNNNIEEWIFWINVIFNNVKKYNYLKKNAFKSSQRFTWKIRAEKIINFSKKVFILDD